MRSLLAGLALWTILAPELVCSAQSDCLKRTIPVGVYSKDGLLALSLSAVNFKGTLHKVPVAVRSVRLAEESPRFILLSDTSGSMQEWADLAVDAAEAVVSKLPPQIEAGLAFFSQTTTPVQLPTTDREATRKHLEALRRSTPSWRGKTALRSAINDGIKMFGDSAAGDAVYAISDGDDNASHLNEKQLREGIAGTGVRVFALQLERRDLQHYHIGQGLGESKVLEDLVQLTGGTLIYKAISGSPPREFPLVGNDGNPTQSAQDLERQLKQFLNFYRVEIELPEIVAQPKDWRLELTGMGKSQQQSLTLMYPTLLTPCH